jgi:3-hydroxybutyryl-CoA dehydrogenase
MQNVQQAVVVGAGTMGHGIAQVLAMAGVKTFLVDVDRAFVDAALGKVTANLDAGVAKGKVDAAVRDRAVQNLVATTNIEDARAADLLVEAIPEKMALKRELFAKADALLAPGALLASNTSSLSITEIASATKRPEDVIGLHFFNPVHIMKLLEIVKGARTSAATIERALAIGTLLGKTTIVVNDAPGFATSRLGICFGNEAMRMLEEGVASAADIDTAMKLGYGHPMGPLALSDLVGLDVRLSICEALYAELGTDGFRAPRIMKRLVRQGALGKKTGRGFYIWQNGEIVGENTER